MPMQYRRNGFVGMIAILILLISTSLSAQKTEVPPLDVERYTTPIDAQNVDQLERLFIKSFPEHQWIDDMASDQSDRVVAAISQFQAPLITVWYPVTGDTRQFDPLDGLPENLQSEPTLVRVAVNPDGTKLAASIDLESGESALEIWDVPGEEVAYTEVMQDDMRITNTSAMRFSPDGQYLVAATGSRDLTWWDVATGAKVNTISYHDYDLERTELDNPPPGNIRDVFITPDNRVYFGLGFTIFEWNLVTNQLGHVYAISFAVRIPDAPPDGRPRGIPTYQDFPSDYNIISIAVSPDERYIVTGHFEGVLVWDTQDPVWDMSYEHWDDAITRIGEGDIAGVFVVQFTPAGDVILATNNDGLIAVSTESWEQVARFDFPRSTILQLALNESGSILYLNSVNYGIGVLAVGEDDGPFELPASSDPDGICFVEVTVTAYFYTQPIERNEYVYIDTYAGDRVHPVGRLADNSWWLDESYGLDLWIQSSAFGPETTVTGDCEDVPVVEAP